MNSRERWRFSTHGVNLSREQVDARQQAQCPMPLVFVIARDAGMLARYRRQVRRRIGNRLDARLLVVTDERDVGRGLAPPPPLQLWEQLGAHWLRAARKMATS